MKKFLIVIAVILLLVVAFIVFLPNMLAAGLKEALPSISESIGKEITIASVEFSWRGSCKIQDLQIKDEDGNVFSAAWAEADIGVMPLFSNKILINNIHLENAELVIRKDKGRLNVSHPDSPEEEFELRIPEIDEDTRRWIEAAWNTLCDYLEKQKESPPTDDESEWSFGLDNFYCGDLRLVLENEEKSQFAFKSTLKMTGLGDSSRDFLLSLKGADASPYMIKIVDGQMDISGIQIKTSGSKKYTIDGAANMSLLWKGEGLKGHFQLDGITYLYNDKYPPLKDLKLGAQFQGKGRDLDWQVDKEFFNLQDAAENAALAEIDKKKKELEAEAQRRIDEEIQKSKDKLKDKLKDIFK
jgi:uncharacterized protein involved in outer membrane biogenesis